MRISIATICRNQESFIATTMQSVLTQPDVDLQYIVYDANSSDGSQQRMLDFTDDRVQVISRKDNGPADGLNHAFSHVDGDVFGYINGDDFYLPGALSYVVEQFQARPSLAILHGGGVIVDESGRVQRRVAPRPYNAWMSAAGISFTFQQATFFRTSFLPPQPFNPENRTSWDGELVMDLAKRNLEMKMVPVALGAFRIHSGSITSQGPSDEYLDRRRRATAQALGRELTLADKALATLIRGPLGAYSKWYPLRLPSGARLDPVYPVYPG